MEKRNFYLSYIKSKNDLKKLFIEEWNWVAPSIKKLIFRYPENISNNIEEAEILAEKLEFKIILFGLKEIQNPDRKL
ncbi:MAG: hypothetical protein RMJ34_07265, partial [candidate division WOR-3 bacterium]|nr:hypothetical protein [candidate division WOR-3 bacterium]